jgi:hypothetical protein
MNESPKRRKGSNRPRSVPQAASVNDAGGESKRKTEILADQGGMQHQALVAATLPAHAFV